MRSGYVELPRTAGRLRSASYNGIIWSSFASSRNSNNSSVPSAYNFNFNAGGVVSSNGPDYRWVGLPLRRLAGEATNRYAADPVIVISSVIDLIFTRENGKIVLS